MESILHKLYMESGQDIERCQRGIVYLDEIDKVGVRVFSLVDEIGKVGVGVCSGVFIGRRDRQGWCGGVLGCFHWSIPPVLYDPGWLGLASRSGGVGRWGRRRKPR